MKSSSVASLASPNTILGVRHESVYFNVPRGACDSHVHIFGPTDSFPYAADRVYTPASASISELRALHAQLGIQRVVVVQASPYETDNRCLLDALRRIGPNARGVVALDSSVTDSELEEMHDAGVRGARLNLQVRGIQNTATAIDELQWLAEKVKPRDWHIQVFSALPMFASLYDVITKNDFPPIVVDHFCLANAQLGIAQPGFDELIALVRSGKVWVKLSSPQRISDDPDGPDVASIAHALIDANPARMLWGTDWPHPGPWPGVKRDPSAIEPFHPFDDGCALNRFWRWTAQPALAQQILVDNPAHLYGFMPHR